MLFASLLSFLLNASPSPTSIIIEGYTSRISAYPGDSVDIFFHASEIAENLSVALYDLDGQKVATIGMNVFPQEMARHKPYENGFGYKLTKRVMTPPLKSGVYLWENKVPFIIKSRQPKIVVLYSSNTENAYNNAGGKSLYGFNSSDNTASVKASFLRPGKLPRHSEAFLRWISAQNYADVGYICDVDMDDYASIRKSELLVIPGHSEYWTLSARRNFDRFVREGKNAMVLSGNTMWWQVRYNLNGDQLMCYRKFADDPNKSTKLKTINWNDPSLGFSILASLGADFPRAGYGTKEDKGWNGYKIISESPLLENTKLFRNSILSFESDELDGAPLSGFVDGIPLLNYEALGFEKAEIIGYDLVSRAGVEGVATWIVFKATSTSGIVINTASTDWCSSRGIGRSEDIQKITATMIDKLLKKENVFSPSLTEKRLPALTQ